MKRVPIIYEGIEVGYSFVDWNPETQEITIISSVVTNSEIPKLQAGLGSDYSILPVDSDLGDW